MLDQNYKLLQSNKSCIKQLIQFLALCQESERKKLCSLLIACDEFSGCHESFFCSVCVAKITLNKNCKKKKRKIPSTPL